MNAFSIIKAKDAGYYVTQTHDNSGDFDRSGFFRGVLCAGTLTECLDYIVKQFHPLVKVP